MSAPDLSPSALEPAYGRRVLLLIVPISLAVSSARIALSVGVGEQALDRGEFRLDCQPKVNLRLGTVTGVEARLRRVHPTDRQRLPGRFQPHIEGHPIANGSASGCSAKPCGR